MDCSLCESKCVEIALLKEQIAERDATIAEDKKTFALPRAQIPTTTSSESTTSAEFIKRGAPFDDAHLGRDDEEEQEAQLVAVLPPSESTYVKGVFIFSISS